MKIYRILFVFVAVFLFAGCEKSSDGDITGTWANEKEDLVIEFHGDGSFSSTDKGRTVEGGYEMPDKSTLLIDVDQKQMKYKIDLSGDTLKMTDPEGHQGTIELERTN